MLVMMNTMLVNYIVSYLHSLCLFQQNFKHYKKANPLLLYVQIILFFKDTFQIYKIIIVNKFLIIIFYYTKSQIDKYDDLKNFFIKIS